jgi:nicotinate-nucleotide adenylyltransferase
MVHNISKVVNDMISHVSKVGIMGGTFDPIHFGHLVTAQTALDLFALDQVIFVPSGNPPHKKEYQVTKATDRHLMTTLAVVANPYFNVSTLELDREGYSYAVDTVKAFKQLYGPNCQLFFITGFDAILEILTWKQYDELINDCTFIAATRPGYDLSQFTRFQKQLPEHIKNKIEVMEVPALAISSTDIRERVKAGRTIKYLLPESVEQYINKHNLYL